jgi:glutaredoxin 3
MTSVRIYTTSICPFCAAAKRLLSEVGADVEEIRLDDRPELRQQLAEANHGWRTVPMIFVADEFLGGFTEVLELHRAGQLLPRLERAAS